MIRHYIPITSDLAQPVSESRRAWIRKVIRTALEAEGMDVTENLANYINHPSRELHQLFADALLETLQGEV